MMQGWRIHEMKEAVTARVMQPMSRLAPALDGRVEVLWRTAQDENPELFNGRVFSADTVTADCIEGHWTEYRRVIAQIRDPRLYHELQVRPLATCGLLIGPDGVVFGRRSHRAAYQAGMWQLPPAGSVDDGAADSDRVDLRGQLLRELREELGITATDTVSTQPLCAVEHPGSRVLDLGFEVHTGLSAMQIATAHASARDAEYTELRVIPLAALPAALHEMGASVVPPARIFLRRAGLLSEKD